MLKFFANPRERESGVTMVETAMLLPWMFVIILGIIQLTLYLYTRNVVDYAAFMAARSAVVWGNSTLETFHYGFGNESQSVAIATARKIIFESLPWEHKRIDLSGSNAKRSYYDLDSNAGAVQLKNKSEGGVRKIELVYCMPIIFNIEKYFMEERTFGRCLNTRGADGKTYRGLEIKSKVELLENP
jgi:hypothetical protein